MQRVTSSLKWKLVSALVVLTASVFLILAYALVQQKRQKILEAALDVENVTRLLDQSISSSAQQIDLSLRVIAAQLQEQLSTHRPLKRDAVDRLLAMHRAWHGSSIDFRVTDEQGDVRYGPGVQSVPYASYADRPFFDRLRQSDDSGMVVSKPVLGKVSRVWVVVFARRYNRPDGAFAGVIVAAVPIANFTAFLKDADLGAGGVALLRADDGGLLTRYPV